MAESVAVLVGESVSAAQDAPAAVAAPAHPADKGKLRVFISYSRIDHEFANQLLAALETCGFECVIDREDISGGEDWKGRLGALIAESDTVVFVLSPASAASAICGWEVERSAELGKRVLPIVCRALGDAAPPPRLQNLNYVFFYADSDAPGSGFGQGLKLLVQALNTDFDWLREHTRYLERATEWDQGGRPAIRLLTGADIAAAKAWAARRPRTAPEPTALQLDFFRASEDEDHARTNAELQRAKAMQDANADREAALREKEAALERERQEQIRGARVRRNYLVSLFAGCVALAAVLGFTVFLLQTARALLDDAKPIVAAAQYKMDRRAREGAFEFFQTAANFFRDPNAIGYLGVSYRNGWNAIGKDYPKAIENLTKAANKGDRNAMDNLAAIYDSGEAMAFGTPQNFAKAREWYEKAGEGPDGLAASMVNLAHLYERGRGLAAPDPAKAREWYEKAANKPRKGPPRAPEDFEYGQAEAMFALGKLYEDGRGVTADPAKAREWYREAAKAGHSDAMVRLAEIYENGLGVDPDIGEALDQYRTAAQRNDAQAMFRLGDLSRTGQGVAQDTGEAVAWFECAAGLKHPASMSSLAALYETGATIAANPDKAQAWRAAAAKAEPPMHLCGDQ